MPVSWKELQERVARRQEEERPLVDRVRDILRAHPNMGYKANEVHAFLRGNGWALEAERDAQQSVMREMLLGQIVLSDVLVAVATKQPAFHNQVEAALKELERKEEEHVVTDGTHYLFRPVER